MPVASILREIFWTPLVQVRKTSTILIKLNLCICKIYVYLLSFLPQTDTFYTYIVLPLCIRFISGYNYSFACKVNATHFVVRHKIRNKINYIFNAIFNSALQMNRKKKHKSSTFRGVFWLRHRGIDYVIKFVVHNLHFGCNIDRYGWNFVHKISVISVSPSVN